MRAALVNALGALSGIGVALLPLRSDGFVDVRGMRSQIEGNSGEEEMMTTEPSSAILVGEAQSWPLVVAVLRLSSREKTMRLARASLGETTFRAGSFVASCERANLLPRGQAVVVADGARGSGSEGTNKNNNNNNGQVQRMPVLLVGPPSRTSRAIS